MATNKAIKPNDFGIYGASTTQPGVSVNNGVIQLTIYQNAVNMPATPQGGSFNFTTGVFVPPSGWSASGPQPPISTIWFSTAIVLATTITISWSVPSPISSGGGITLTSPLGTINLTSTAQAQAGALAQVDTASPTGFALTQLGASNYGIDIANRGSVVGQVLVQNGTAFVPGNLAGSGQYYLFPINASGVNQAFTSPIFASYGTALQMNLFKNGISLRPNSDYTFDNPTNTVTLLFYATPADVVELNPQGLASNPNPNSGVYELINATSANNYRGNVVLYPGVNVSFTDAPTQDGIVINANTVNGSAVNVGWNDPATMPVTGLFIGQYTQGIADGQTVTTSGNDVFPSYFYNVPFNDFAGANVGLGVRANDARTIVVVSGADQYNQYLIPKYTTDGITFNACTLSSYTAPTPSSISFGNTAFFAASAERFSTSSSAIVTIWYSLDGMSWSNRQVSFTPSYTGLTAYLFRLRFGLGRYLFIDNYGGVYYTVDPTTAINLTTLPTTSFPLTFTPNTFAVYNNRYYFCGQNNLTTDRNVANYAFQITAMTAPTGNPPQVTITVATSATSLANVFVAGQYVTISGALPNTINNVDTATQVKVVSVTNATTIVVQYPAGYAVGTYTSGGTLIANPALYSLDSNFANGQYEPTYNWGLAVPNATGTINYGGEIISVVTDTVASRFVYTIEGNPVGRQVGAVYFFTAVSGQSFKKSIGAQGANATNILYQTLGGTNYWVLTCQRTNNDINLNQGFIYICNDDIANTSNQFMVTTSGIGTSQFNRLWSIGTKLIVGQANGLQVCNADNQIYASQGGKTVPIGTYRCLGKTSSQNNIYYFTRLL